jgi:hypothetical protein
MSPVTSYYVKRNTLRNYVVLNYCPEQISAKLQAPFQ